MDIGSLSIAMSQQSLQSAVQLSVIKMGLNSTQEMANNLTEMVSVISSEPNKGINLDRRV